MAESTRRPPRRSPETHIAPRQILGISLDPKMASEVKAYAGKHSLSLRKLFEEMWRVYKKQKPD
jgi:hypothetical protein